MILRYWNTLRHLKPIQVANRIKRKIFHARVNTSPAPAVRLNSESAFYYIRRPKSIMGNNEFVFLNRQERLSFPISWNDPSLSKLWLYNLHYFEGLLQDETPSNLKHRLIDQWINENPPALGNGWEPYPNSLRIINWIKWALDGNELSHIAHESLAVQVRYLEQTLEYHLLGNHLLANAKALVFAGIFFQGSEAENWFKKGHTILKKEISEQFLPDGAHFELSTTYHALLTEDLLDIVQILQRADKSIPKEWLKTASKALQWLVVMTRPDGLPPLFNDAAYGITPSLDEILSFAKKLGINTETISPRGMNDLPHSGYYCYKNDLYSFFGDAGHLGPDYNPGHGHCDIMNFELFAHNKPYIVDTGTSTYDDGEHRQYERSTAAHNTVQLGDKEQSEMWGGFRVGKRARITNRVVDDKSISITHNGFGVAHTRNIAFESSQIEIVDTVSDESIAIARFHFHPDIALSIEGDIVIADRIRLQFQGHIVIEIQNSYYAPEFNELIPNQVLQIKFKSRLCTKILL